MYRTLIFRCSGLILLFFTVIIVSINGQSQEMAYVDSIYHICGEEAGFVKMGINGVPAEYDYYWDDGSTELRRTDLMPGRYNFTIRDRVGCIETHNIEVIRFVSPKVEIYQSDLNPCKAELGIVVSEVLSSQNRIIQPEGLDIKWVGLNNSENFEDNGNYIVVNRPTAGIYSVVINLSKNNYCTVSAQHQVTASSFITYCSPKDVPPKGLAGTESRMSENINDIHIYPNPAEDVLNVENAGDLLIRSVELRSMGGRLLLSHRELNSKKIRLDLNNTLKSGIYFIKINLDGGQIINEKVVIVK